MRNFPWLGYSTILVLFLLVLCFQSCRVAAAKKAVSATVRTAEAIDASSDQQQETLKASQAYRKTCATTRVVFKTGFLLLIVLPLSVLLPTFFAGQAPGEAPRGVSSRKVVSAREMTLDDIDRGVPDDDQALMQRRRLMQLSFGAFLVFSAIAALFMVFQPDAYLRGGDYGSGPVRTGLFFLVSALMVFCGSAMVFPLRETYKTPPAVGLRLGAGFAVLGVLTLIFL